MAIAIADGLENVGNTEVKEDKVGNRKNQIRLICCIVGLAVVMAGAAVAAKPNLMAAFFVKGKVGLKWGKVAGASEYLVFRKGPGGDFVQIASTDKDKYFDEAVEGGKTYAYKIAVVEGGEQIFSGTKSVSIPGTSGDFAPPTWVGIRYDQDKLYLNWDPVPGAVAYNIWRSETAGSGYEVVGTSQGSRHVEKEGLLKGTTYYYVLSAMNQDFDETPLSEERSAKFGLSLEEQEALIAAESKIELEPVNLKELFEISEGPDGAPLNQPSDVFVNSKGVIYVSDTLNGRINCYDPQGKPKFAFGERVTDADGDLTDGSFMFPFTLYIDKQDQVYVSDVKRHDIQVFDESGSFLRRIEVLFETGLNPLRANGLYVLDDGRLVMTDAGNHRWLVTDANGRVQVAVGSRGTDEGQFIFPDELTVTADGTVCVVDPINCRIQEFSLDGAFVRSFGGSGMSAGMFGRPKGITTDAKGMLWVTDAMSNMIQGFTEEGEVRNAIGTADDDWSYMTPRGIHFHDGSMFVVQRLHHKVTVQSMTP